MTELRKKPLVEVILEVRWGPTLSVDSPPPDPDSNYSLLVGRLFDRVRQTYPFHEQLPTAQFPEQMLPGVAQHRFRAAPNDWPLIQLGPGLLTLNETVKYSWQDFRSRAMTAVEYLFAAHPAPQALRIQQLTLRYLDAIRFDRDGGNVLDFLREKLKLNVELPEDLFVKYDVATAASQFVTQLSFPAKKPKGTVTMKVGLGQAAGASAIVLDTAIESKGDEVPVLPRDFAPWLDEAHWVASEWFKELTKGELYESFVPVRN